MQLYIEPFSGLSGDMFLGALCDLSGEYERIEALPAALGLERHARIEFTDVSKNGIRCRQVRIIDLEAQGGHRPHRHLADLQGIVEGSSISGGAKRIGREILTEIARAEAQIHGIAIEQVHFHEVGGLDSLLDIVGSAVLIDRLAVERTYSDPVCTGFGSVQTQHGLLPVPAPATAALLRGMPTYKGDETGERTTPTGAAILRYLAPDFHPPRLIAHKIGYGPGRKDFEAPNLLRLSRVEPADAALPGPTVGVIECNIDDAPAEFLGGDLQDDLRAQGARDVFLTPIQMKKGRPGTQLTVLAASDSIDAIATWLLENTSTIGVRWYEAKRRELPRRTLLVETPYGRVEVKEVTTPAGAKRCKIEYESIRRISEAQGMSLAQTAASLLPAVTAATAFGLPDDGAESEPRALRDDASP
jgi:uncharacterized protein (TIGR00299 family) protein